MDAMPGSVEKIPDKPIAIVTYHGHISVEDTRAVFAQVAGLVDVYGSPFYRLTRVSSSDSDTSFDELMRMTVVSSKGIPGSATDPNVTTIFVGQSMYFDLFVDAMQQDSFGGVEIPMFDTMDEAMAYVEEQLSGSHV